MALKSRSLSASKTQNQKSNKKVMKFRTLVLGLLTARLTLNLYANQKAHTNFVSVLDLPSYVQSSRWHPSSVGNLSREAETPLEKSDVGST